MTIPRLAARCGPTLALSLALISPARAGTPEDAAAGVALFQEARKLATAGDFAHACPKFVEASRLIHTAGTLLSVGDCFEHLGNLASAWGTFQQAEILARSLGDSPRETEAARRAGLLAPRLAKLSIVVPLDARVPGIEVRRDGSIVGEGQWGTALPIDTGEHKIEATAPNYRPWSTVVRIEANAAGTSIEIRLQEKPPAESASAPAVSTPAFTWSPRRIAGASVGGVGLLGGVIGAILGAATLEKIGAAKSERHCNESVTVCDAIGIQMQKEATQTANGSNAALAIGGAALAAGIVLFVTAPRGAAAEPKSGARVTLGPVAGAQMTGVLLRGGW